MFSILTDQIKLRALIVIRNTKTYNLFDQINLCFIFRFFIIISVYWIKLLMLKFVLQDNYHHKV